MNARITAALALAVAAMLAAGVAKVMVWSVLAGTLAACVVLIAAGWYVTWRMIGGPGRHKAPLRRYDEPGERIALPCERAIPWTRTQNAPPWDFQPAPVIEPAAITSGPPEPEPDGYWLAAGTYSRATGQVRTVRVELLPPVAELLGHASTQDAVDALAAGWHSVESLFNGFHAREVRALTDGTS